jgi:hypothetical protein
MASNLLLHGQPNFERINRGLDIMHPDHRSSTLYRHEGCGHAGRLPL